MARIKSIMIITHYNCNFHCSYCNQREIAQIDKSILSYEEVFNFIDWLYKTQKLSNELNIQFEGGETLIRWKTFIKPLVEKITKNLPIKPQYSLFTNGTILTQELLNFLEQNDFIITLSIDGDKNVFEEQRNAKFFSIVEQNLTKFLTLSNKIRINAVFTPNTVQYLYSSYMFFVKHGVRIVSFSPDNRITVKWTDKILHQITEQFIKILEEDNKYHIIESQNMLWNSKNIARNKKDNHNQSLRIYPNKKISFNADPFLKNEQKTDNCTLNNYITNFQDIDQDIDQQEFILTNSPENCDKCISKYICPKPTITDLIQTSPALCAMRVAFLIQEQLENG